MLIVILVGRWLSKRDVASALTPNSTEPWYQGGVLFLIRFVVPVLIVAVLVKTILNAL